MKNNKTRTPVPPTEPGFVRIEGTPLFVKKDGTVWSDELGRILAPHLTVNGYHRVSYSRDGKCPGMLVHRMVLTAFSGPPPSKTTQTRHLDGSKLNNHISNLKWGTAKENHDDKIKHGGQVFGERAGASKLKLGDVKKIRSLLLGGMSQRKAAKKYGVAQGTIWAIASQRSWNQSDEKLCCLGGGGK